MYILSNSQKTFCFALCFLLVLSVFSGALTANAAGSEVRELPAGIVIGDQDGMHADAHGAYYLDARKLTPGEVIHKIIVIQNLTQGDRTPEGHVPYKVAMTAEPVTTRGPVDLLDTHCIMRLDGKLVYEGAVRGDGAPNMNTTALNLGEYKVGDRHTLDVTLTVDPNAQFGEELSEADFKWTFYAYRELKEEPPKTGITAFLSQYGYLIPVMLVLQFGIILIPMKKRRDERKLDF